MISLDKTFKKILQEWGYDVYIQRKLFNGNYSDSLERVTTRSVFPNGKINSQSKQEEDEGIIINSDIVYYFEAEVNPQEGDRVYEQLPNAHGRQTIYVIDTASPMRGRMGKITFWTVGATRDKQV
jgi:hypothetical protein